ncbi:MAG: Gfo/Idh/MocA family oxidoreductase [Candidatus Marinimicrobia bacterium]|nr:Gfo/Idh/MocA family oxidoreductase [Candidatus Neomarinimicrobiota bacterium]
MAEKKVGMSRSEFIVKSATAAAAFTIIPRFVLGRGMTAPSDKLNIAGVGIGGMGKTNLEACATENIVALCDIDQKFAAETFKLYPRAKVFKDYRVMLDEMDSIEAVVIATPDHTHAVIALEAMRRGKHVYVQKPLTHDVYESRLLLQAARKYGVVTQMGNQGHSGEGLRLMKEWIWDGAIGDVREVMAWTNRPIWPQGMERPKRKKYVPRSLDWDLFLGPAPKRPYHPAYHPFVWRGWWDFGTGALGDMACHIMDAPYAVLKLGHPTTIEATSTSVNDESAPLASIVRYEFPARGAMPPVKLSWYDGGLMPERPDGIEEGRRMGDDSGGALFIGDKGMLMCNTYARNPRLVPETAMQAYQRPEKSLPRVDMGHEQEWIAACKGGPTPSSDFEVAVPFTETVLLGNIAIRAQENRKLEWDGEKMEITNLPEANRFVRREYRSGWELEI